MFKNSKKLFSNLFTMYKRQSFKNKPVRTIYYISIMLILLLFKIKKIYKINIRGKSFLYTYKPYLNMGMGGRSQFVLREYYDPFLTYGMDILPKNFNFIDVGCSRGFFTLFLLASNNPEGKGICIDPFKYALSDLSEVIMLNKFSNAYILRGIVSDKNHEKVFLRNVGTPSEASIIKKETHDNENGFYCKSYTIDQMVYSMNLIDSVEFIKLDVESAEFEVLLGSEETLKNFRPIIYLEITRKEKEIREFLIDNNYSLHHFSHNKLIPLKKNVSPDSIVAKPLN